MYSAKYKVSNKFNDNSNQSFGESYNGLMINN